MVQRGALLVVRVELGSSSKHLLSEVRLEHVLQFLVSCCSTEPAAILRLAIRYPGFSFCCC